MSRVVATSQTHQGAGRTTTVGSPIMIGDAAHLTRRLDWRFLLPTSHLGRVAYIGPGKGALLPALTHFCDHLALPRQQPVGRGSVDLLVAQSVSREQLASSLDTLSTGGVVYWEISPLHRMFGPDYRHLERLGLETLNTFWHYPDFERCEVITPLTAPAALAWLAARRLRGTDRRTLLRASRWFTTVPSLWRILPSVSVIARKRDPSWP